MMRKIQLAFFVVALFFLSSWGFLVHRTVNQLAIYRLPRGLQALFYQERDYLVRHSVRPDLRRNEDSLEASRHFIDFEAFGDSAAWRMPSHWEEAAARYSPDTLRKYGYVPYHILRMKDLLTGAFRQRNKDSILFYAADLSHYIADAHVPLHTTLNYDGQLTNQRGLHALWESVVPELELAHYDLYAKGKAQYIADPAAYIWQAVRESHAMLPSVLEEERLATAAFTDSTKYRRQMRNGKEVKYFTAAFAEAYSHRLGSSINDRLKKTAVAIADFWYTCWVDGGQPDLGDMLSSSTHSQARAQLRAEWKAFRQNELITKGWLLAKKATGGTE